MSEEKDIQAYYRERMAQLGVTEENNVVMLDANEHPKSFENGKQDLYPAKIFEVNEHGDIVIALYTIRRKAFSYPEKGVQGAANRTRYDSITRLHPDRVTDGKKYHITGKTGTHPWFHPKFLDWFEKKEQVKTVYITEGAFKAYMATQNGMPTIALSSITHYKDKNTQTLHPDILDFIHDCQVENVVILWDGDCLNLSASALADKEDLYKRPGQFFHSVRTITDLLKEYIDVKKTNVWFSHINTRELEKNPKGFDDLLIYLKDQMDGIREDFFNLNRPGIYFAGRRNLTSGMQSLQKYFRIDNANNFYAFHSEQIKDQEFVFNGSNYKHDGKELKMIKPAVAKNYFRVGDQYYMWVNVPNKWGQKERTYVRISKETIKDDFDKAFLNHVRKYNAFCVVPDHVNYQPEIDNCFNAYGPFEHEAKEGECAVTLDYFRHLFQEHYEMGLDYMQLLLKEPQRKLPILCLVSRENKTGKSTFAFYLKAFFKANVAIVGNAEIADNFNAGWANKLVVICDESFIEKKATVEKIKALSTADKIFVNAKGRDHVEMDFFAKFILITNNEENFIYATDQDTRYWVRKVPVIKEERPILKEMIDEIPAFLHFLNTRKLHTPDVGTRLYFTPEQITTNALKKVIEYNAPTAIKEIKSRLSDLFIEFDLDVIYMTAKTIHKEFFNNSRYELNYLHRLLQENLKVDFFKNADGKQVTKRFAWPKVVTTYEGEETHIKQVFVKETGRPYVFHRKDFVDPELKIVMDKTDLPATNQTTMSLTEPDDDVPF